MATCIFKHELAEVWHGDALHNGCVDEVMGGRVADALIVDAPYSERTHSGHRRGKLIADRAADGGSGYNDIDYAAWSPTDVANLAECWAQHVSGWWVSITDHVLARAWESEFSETLCLLTFTPLPLVQTGATVRMAGDGPANWTCQIIVGRPRREPWSKWGALPGYYVQSAERMSRGGERSDRIVGGKPIKSMMAIVSDYSRPGQLVVDPCAGAGTTLLAALRTGRRAIGVEKDLGRAQLTADRVKAELAHSTRHARVNGQSSLFEV